MPATKNTQPQQVQRLLTAEQFLAGIEIWRKQGRIVPYPPALAEAISRVLDETLDFSSGTIAHKVRGPNGTLVPGRKPE